MIGYKEISLELPTDFTETQLKSIIAETLNIKDFSYQIEKQSLDARKKNRIHWQTRVAVSSPELKGTPPETAPELAIPHSEGKSKVVVVGNGPAGFFAAFTLQQAGFMVTLLERGHDVEKRNDSIIRFEKTAEFDPSGNYAFGEGGAGTFSDGKLTARSKRISLERQFILSTYIKAGAPEEIRYMAHPHLGSNNLKKMVKKLRGDFCDLGGTVQFETLVKDLKLKNRKITAVITEKGEFEADYVVFATGLAAYETYRMLIKNGVLFRPKNFAIGYRMEHEQSIINKSQWGCDSIPGLKAAEYRLTSPGDGKISVYSFCMCPGGTIVPSGAYGNTNIVNGMSMYARSGRFANAGIVAGVHPEQLIGGKCNASEALDWVQMQEEHFFEFAGGYAAPFCSIRDFLKQRMPEEVPETSYPLGLKPAALWNLLPREVSKAIRKGLQDFSRKVNNFKNGNIMGLESKTSSPIQVLRDENGLCDGFDNLYMVGEGSGFAGGIISSAADGIRAARAIGKF